MLCVDGTLLDQLTDKARQSPRLRMNHNFHPADDAACHRLLNAVEPGSYIRPHRHLDREKDETFVLIRGALGVLTFTDDGSVAATTLLIAGTDTCIVTIPHGVWHTAVSLAPGTIFFEAKAGPYLPFTEQETASWAPTADAVEAPAYLRSFCASFSAS
ncbi:WbuC family cupin fold metalloprotein [Trichlorobacter ammonificans]|uniref:Tryptophan synthase beta chain like n=1 Tax=Trichlorobacter ammonificans TaxID=2916410 RepID=A0ABN8HRQ4_9BACT|nr:WbuC family cupin fold metalloprotein [Trichlorobacter ammonificans]CAH2032680.1 Tryptophan synthase beta chain like [Trichlorobacter ammonificans]